MSNVKSGKLARCEFVTKKGSNKLSVGCSYVPKRRLKKLLTLPVGTTTYILGRNIRVLANRFYLPYHGRYVTRSKVENIVKFMEAR